MSISSTGTNVAAVSPKAEGAVSEALRRRGTVATCVGAFKESADRTLTHNNKKENFPLRADDPYGKMINA